ncbi:hypothetical protein [Paenibacillus agricola]|uniref:TrbC/VIRB2 family protein n=1 Tax=Paenibacillus agricola TaxID=2716264 RepID=A0ABX0JED3_9BACL|nr:hypothetical protein [Paenibacillus agricola]NHN34897.1 hypothetical protein [Paenibacillus agricola]
MKKGMALILMLCISMMFGTLVFAGGTPAITTPAKAGGTMDKIKAGSSEGLTDKIDESTTKLLSIVRQVGILFAVLFICWIGWGMYGAANPQGLAAMKMRIIFFLLGLYVAIFPEDILGAILGIMDYDPT